ncbi:MAG: SIR2 family protein [Helicobacteraceae bacterium]|nr:SIR2 family protein [Helicobacteraceae bacterium]
MIDVNNEAKDEIFGNIQKFLKDPPVIIWGSGATVPFGLPTMNDLTDAIIKEFPEFPKGNLEVELGKISDIERKKKIRRIIWEEIGKKDLGVQQEIKNGEYNKFEFIIKMIEKFREAHPQVVNIITTNYDCTLEYLFAWHDIHFTDGFTGKIFSKFDATAFSSKKIVNIIKVHGSLNWFTIDGTVRFLNRSNAGDTPVFIIPGKDKYEEAYNIPFRDLIQISDGIINKAKSFLVVGFGFNDKHLTPKIKEKVREGVPLALITKKVSDFCKEELKDGRQYILIEEAMVDKTRVTIKNNESPHEFVIDGDYWQLKHFMEVI